jgi:hypothetical protein
MEPSGVLYDVEVRILRSYYGGFQVLVRSWDGEVSERLEPLPLKQLDRARSSPREYGEALYGWLFRGSVGEAFQRLRDSADDPGAGLRLRIGLEPKHRDLTRARMAHKGLEPEDRGRPRTRRAERGSAPDDQGLLRLRWETLHEPDGYVPLSLNTAFSRYVPVDAPRGWPISERPLRMLVVASDPMDRGFADQAVDLNKRIARWAKRSWGQLVEADILGSRPTLEQIRAEMERPYHVVHILAQREVEGERAVLLLADERGRGHPVPEEVFAELIVAGRDQTPYLVFLGSPADIPMETGAGEHALPVMLLEGGVQAVVSIQSGFRADLLGRFTDRFYASLFQQGAVDVGMTEARAEVFDMTEWEWTCPILYVRTPEPRMFQPLDESVEGKVVGIRRIG